MIASDTYRHKGLRKRLIEALKNKGIEHTDVLEALGRVLRHCFLDPAFVEFAYEDKPFPIGQGQTISQPYTVAYQSIALDITHGCKVLEIGTGSGYQAAVLAEMGAKVFSIERHKTLYERSKKLLQELNYRHIKCFFGDGYKGLPAFAPFDRILVTAAASQVPEALKSQLKIGGKLVVPVGSSSLQVMTKITRVSENEFSEITGDNFKFVPFVQGKKW